MRRPDGGARPGRRAAGGRADVEPVLIPEAQIVEAINKVYSRGRIDAELDKERGAARRGQRPRKTSTCSNRTTKRRSSAGQLAALPRGREARLATFTSSRTRRIWSCATASTAFCTRQSRRPARFINSHHLPRQDHGRPEHRREAPAAGRPHPPQDRRQGHRHPRRRPCRPASASASSCVCSTSASVLGSRELGFGEISRSTDATHDPSDRTASCWSPAPPAAARRRRCTPRCRRSTPPTSTSSPSKIRSSTSCTASTRFRSTPRSS